MGYPVHGRGPAGTSSYPPPRSGRTRPSLQVGRPGHSPHEEVDLDRVRRGGSGPTAVVWTRRGPRGGYQRPRRPMSEVLAGKPWIERGKARAGMRFRISTRGLFFPRRIEMAEPALYGPIAADYSGLGQALGARVDLFLRIGTNRALSLAPARPARWLGPGDRRGRRSADAIRQRALQRDRRTRALLRGRRAPGPPRAPVEEAGRPTSSSSTAALLALSQKIVAPIIAVGLPQAHRPTISVQPDGNAPAPNATAAARRGLATRLRLVAPGSDIFPDKTSRPALECVDACLERA